MTEHEARLDDLLAFEAIRALKARYFRCLDTKDWAGFAAVFTEDATLDVSEDATIFAAYGLGFADDPLAVTAGLCGGPAIAGFVRDAVGGTRTVHHGHMPELTRHAEDAASGIWAMADIVEHGAMTLRGEGHYHELYRRIDGEWRIAATRLTRLRTTFLVPATGGGWVELPPPSGAPDAPAAIRPLPLPPTR